MKHLMVVIHDLKAQLYTTPMYFPARGAAIRAFSDVVNDPQSQYSKHPADYQLFAVGYYDDNTTELQTTGAPEYIADGADFTDTTKDLRIAK